MMKKLMLLVVLFVHYRVTAMEKTEEMPAVQKNSYREGLVKILLTDSSSTTTHREVMIPLRYAQQIGAISESLSNTDLQKKGFPLLQVTCSQWQFIESQLDRLCQLDVANSENSPADVISSLLKELGELDCEGIVELAQALSHLNIAPLSELVYYVLKQVSMWQFSGEQLMKLPTELANRYVLHTILTTYGAMPVKEIAVCKGHEGKVLEAFVVSPSTIISRSNDKTIRIWDMQGTEFGVCRGHTSKVNSLCVTHDDLIVSGSADNTVRIWNMRGNQIALCAGHEGQVTTVCVTHNSDIVSGSEDNTVRVWNMRGKQLALCTGHEGPVTALGVTINGEIVSGSQDNTVRIWDMEGNKLAVCRGHEGAIRSVCVREDGTLISCSNDRTVRMWDMRGNQLGICKVFYGGETGPACVTGENTIVSASFFNTSVHVQSIHGSRLALWTGYTPKEASYIGIRSLHVSTDNKIISSWRDEAIRVWDMDGNLLASGRELQKENGTITPMNHGKIVSCLKDYSVKVWDVSLLDRIQCMNRETLGILLEFLFRARHKDRSKRDRLNSEVWKAIEEVIDMAMANETKIASLLLAKSAPENNIILQTPDNNIELQREIQNSFNDLFDRAFLNGSLGSSENENSDSSD